MTTSRLEHRLALALFASSQAKEGTWARTFWSQCAGQLDLERKLNETANTNCISSSSCYTYPS